MKNLNSFSRLFLSAFLLCSFFMVQSRAFGQGVPFVRFNPISVVSNAVPNDQVYIGENIYPPSPLPGDKFTVITNLNSTAGAFMAKNTTQFATGVRADALMGTNSVGVEAGATAPKNVGLTAVGVRGRASDGFATVGVWGIATSSRTVGSAIGIRGEATSMTGNTWAGYFVGDVSATGVYVGSDRKLKKDIAEMDGAMGLLMALQPKTYKYRTDEFDLGLPEVQQYGLIAQDLEAVLPALVKETQVAPRYNPDQDAAPALIEYKTVNYIGLIPVLIKGVQEQQATLDAQNQEIADLKAQLAEIRSLIADKSSGLSDPTSSTALVLDQNAPNPFAESTRIAYSLPEGMTNARIIVHGLNGQTVASFDLSQPKGEVTVYGNDLQSGMYSYTLVANGQVIQSRKMIVTK